MCSNVFVPDRILKYYHWSNLQPLKASPFVNQYGEIYFEFVQSLLLDLMGGDLSVLFGYYASDLRIAIKRIDSIFQNEEQAHEIVTFNMLLFEFMYDLLLFDQYRDVPHFFAIFGKYQKQLVGDPGKEFSTYMETLGNAYSATLQEKRNALLKTLNAINFILLHEWAHIEKGIAEKVINVFKNTEGFAQHADQLSEKQLEESACDYTALFFSTSPMFPLSKVIQDKLDCTPTTSMAYGIILHHLDHLLQMLKLGFRMGIEDKQFTVEKIFLDMEQQFNSRCKTLVLMEKFSENELNPILGHIDLQKALLDVATLMKSFFTCLSDAMMLLADKIDNTTKNGTSEPVMEQKALGDLDSIWFLIK